jgi:hypothetical protein
MIRPFRVGSGIARKEVPYWDLGKIISIHNIGKLIVQILDQFRIAPILTIAALLFLGSRDFKE